MECRSGRTGERGSPGGSTLLPRLVKFHEGEIFDRRVIVAPPVVNDSWTREPMPQHSSAERRVPLPDG